MMYNSFAKKYITSIKAQELLFCNLEASYNSIMFYPIQRFLKQFQKIINCIIEEPNAEKICKESTNSVFFALKFLCQNYNHFGLDAETTIVEYLVKYLDKVYQIGNHDLAVEAIYFVLRFIVVEARNGAGINAQKPQRGASNIFDISKYSPSIFEPNKWLLINNISEDEEKNEFIC